MTAKEALEAAIEENARLVAIIYSIFQRHPDVKDESLYLADVDQDIPPSPLVVGWNTIGSDAVVTLVHGETLERMAECARQKNTQSAETSQSSVHADSEQD